MKAFLLVAILSSVVAGTLRHFNRPAARLTDQMPPADSTAIAMPLLGATPAWPTPPAAATAMPR